MKNWNVALAKALRSRLGPNEATLAAEVWNPYGRSSPPPTGDQFLELIEKDPAFAWDFLTKTMLAEWTQAVSRLATGKTPEEWRAMAESPDVVATDQASPKRGDRLPRD